MSETFLKVNSTKVIRENNSKTNTFNEIETENEPVLIIHQTPRPSVIEIDSFVPNLKLQRIRKTSTKNVSLSSSTIIKKLHATTRNPVIDKNANKYRNGVLVIGNNKSYDKINNNIYEYARHQKTSTSRIKSTVTSFGRKFNTNSITSSSHQKNTVNLPLEYSLITNFGGICKILRTQKEKEKLPDRINCDKRGLTSIPLFLNENNLRLLSLQHNLINVFHVPSDENYHNNSPECENKCDDFPILSKINKHNIYFNKFNLKIEPTTQNGASKKKQSILNDELEKQLNSTRTAITNKLCHINTQDDTTLKPEQHNLNSNSKSSYTATVRNTMIQNTKSKNLISPYHTKQFKTLKGELKIKKNTIDSSNLTSLNAVEPTSSTAQDFKIKLVEKNYTSSNVENLFMDKVLLNSSYANIYHNLIFLDLYNNQIEKILNLDGFKSLTVLLLGKNRITDISGILSLRKTLRVLDLHGNRITNISNKINDLRELKSLNLAGNQIEQICPNDFAGLINLKELNLKRNKIKRVYGFDHLLNLERLWLCHNDLQKVEDMSSVAKATNLQEVTVENNPVSMVGDCVSFLVSYLPNLKVLSQMPVTGQVRKAATIWRKNKEISERNNSLYLSKNFYNVRREEVISNARTNWELLRSQRTTSANQKYKTRNKKCVQALNSTVEGYGESSMKQFHSSTFTDLDVSEKTPVITSENNSLANTRILENYFTNQNNGFEELQLPPISEPVLSTIVDIDVQDVQITKSISNSSLSPNLHSSSSGLGSDSEENSETIRSKKLKQALLSSLPSSTSSSISSSPLELKYNEIQNIDTKTQDFNLESENVNQVDNIWNVPNTENDYIDSSSIKASDSLAASIYEKENEIITSNESELHTPKSASTITSKIVNCSSKGSSSSNSVLTINCNSNNLESFASNANLLEKLQVKQTGCASVSCNVNVIKKSNRNSFFRSQTARMSKNNLSSPFSVNYSQNDSNTDKSNANHTTGVITLNKQVNEREREQGGDYLIEICGKYLNIYGIGALRFIDKQWNQNKACDVNTLNFSYINFNNIAYLLNRIKQRFPNADKYIFRETNLQYLGQLNALADLQGIQSLSIDPEGNHIINNTLWKNYAIYRLNHWGLKILNNKDLTQSEIDIAHKEFKILSDIVLWVIPETMLQPIIHKLHFDEKYTMSSLYPKEWLLKTDKTIKEIVGKEALQWKKYNLQLLQSEERCFGEKAKIHFGVMIDNLCNATEKLQIFEIIWPKILIDMVANTLLDYSQMEVYLKKF